MKSRMRRLALAMVLAFQRRTWRRSARLSAASPSRSPDGLRPRPPQGSTSTTETRVYRRLRDRLASLRDPRIDRYILEEVVFPALAADGDVSTLLFVGVDWYTKGYEAHFPGRRFHTIDVDPANARYGAASHHTAALEHSGRVHAPGSLDAVICNGLIGFGLDDRAEAERTIAACHELLRPGGWLILGWNDRDEVRPFHPDELEELRRFVRTPLPPFPTARYPTFSHVRHTFDFYRRPAA